MRLRLQWVTEERRGRALRCEVALAGAALSVVGALQDELFNATLDRVSVVAERSRAEARLHRPRTTRLQPTCIAWGKLWEVGWQIPGGLCGLHVIVRRPLVQAAQTGLPCHARLPCVISLWMMLLALCQALQWPGLMVRWAASRPA